MHERLLVVEVGLKIVFNHFAETCFELIVDFLRNQIDHFVVEHFAHRVERCSNDKLCKLLSFYLARVFLTKHVKEELHSLL